MSRSTATAALIGVAQRALAPSADDAWPTAARLRGLRLGRLVVIPLTIALNLALWWSMHRDPGLRGEVASVFALLNNGLLALDLTLTVALLRRPGRAAAVAIIVGAIIEVSCALIYTQMTGMVTSFLLGTHLFLAILYRFAAGYWAGAAAFAMSGLGFVVAYALETAGVLPRASLYVHDVTPALLPVGYLRAAFTAHCMAISVLFIATNLMARAFERSRADLAATRAELAAVVDEARLGRMSGLRVGGYQLGELLGRGGMGEVYAARGDDGAGVAVKILHAHLGADTAARARFRREANLVQRLPAASVARVLAVGTGPGGTDYIAMERLHGEDLGALLRRRQRLTLDEAVVMARSIADALAGAHAAGIVHRDLKPSNIFLVDDRLDQVRLLDFGIARLYLLGGLGGGPLGVDATITETSAVVGSPGYMAPEQAAGAHDALGPASDVFALGAILYRALTGEPAFPSRSAAAAVFEAHHHRPAPPSSLVALPEGVDYVIGIALAKEPAERYPTAAALVDDLIRATGGAPMRHLASRASGVARMASAGDTMTAADLDRG